MHERTFKRSFSQCARHEYPSSTNTPPKALPTPQKYCSDASLAPRKEKQVLQLDIHIDPCVTRDSLLRARPPRPPTPPPSLLHLKVIAINAPPCGESGKRFQFKRAPCWWIRRKLKSRSKHKKITHARKSKISHSSTVRCSRRREFREWRRAVKAQSGHVGNVQKHVIRRLLHAPLKVSTYSKLLKPSSPPKKISTAEYFRKLVLSTPNPNPAPPNPSPPNSPLKRPLNMGTSM